MTTLYAGYSAIALYICAFLYQAAKVRAALKPSGLGLRRGFLLGISGAAVVLHGLVCWRLMVTTNGLDFSLWQVSSAIFFLVNLIVLLSSLRKPAHNLFLFLFPLAIPLLAITLVTDSSSDVFGKLGMGVGLHILSSILAYSLLTIAAFQAMLLAYQNWQLRHKHLKGWVRVMPPLETMEALLFEVLWTGVILLTLALLSGFSVLEDMFAQKQGHKTVFSLVAWVIYAVLLWGRHQLGWRGNTAIRWTLVGFIATALAYWGSKFVYEVLLT